MSGDIYHTDFRAVNDWGSDYTVLGFWILDSGFWILNLKP
jgi:hypothetical protein